MEKSCIERIREEYQIYKSGVVEDCKAVSQYVSDGLSFFETLDKDIEKHIKYNKKRLKEGKRLGMINDMFGYRDNKYYDRDTEILRLEFLVIDRFRDCYERLLNDVKDNNYKNIYRLARFCRHKFNQSYENLESVRENNKLINDGVDLNIIDVTDDSEDLLQFFEQEMDNIL